MSSTLYLGRVAAPVSVAKFWGASAWDMAGDSVTVKGVISCDSITDALVVRRQLLGLAEEEDEDFIPVWWTADVSVAGFYRVRGVQVDMGKAALVSARFNFTVNLERVVSYSSPSIELVRTGTLRTNSVGITACAATISLPRSVKAVGGLGAGLDGYVYATATGDIVDYAVSGVTSSFTLPVPFYCPPEDWYDGAATIYAAPVPTDTAPSASASLNTTLETWPVVVGRQLPNTPLGWMISNGIVRLFVGTGGASTLYLQGYSGGAWRGGATGNAMGFLVVPDGENGAGATVPLTATWKAMQILRNDPTEVRVRLLGYGPELGDTGFGVNLTLSLRRGSAWIGAVLSTNPVGPGSERLQRAVTEAATTTGMSGTGIKAAAADAVGDRYVLLSPKTFTADTAVGKLTVAHASSSDPPTYPFAIGLAIGDTAGNPFAADGIINDYFCAAADRVGVAGR